MTSAPSPAARSPLGLPWVLIALLVANVLPELLFQLAEQGLIDARSLRVWAFAYGAFQPDVLTGPGPLFPSQPVAMFFTYGFLHTSLSHLVLNMVGLVWLGQRILEYRTGETFVIFYLMAMIGAAELFALIGTGLSPTVGASGALFGLFGVYAMDAGFFASSRPTAEENGLRFFRLSLATVVLALVDMGSQALLGTATAWQAHAGGFLTGAVCALVFPPRYRSAP